MASSGPHSNGYSLIRKVLEISGADTGELLVTDDGDTVTLGDALIAPTRIYVKPVLEMVESGNIHGLAHITGGGLTENVIRAVPAGLGLVIHPHGWRRPAVFNWLQHHGNITEAEMLRTFNCGIGMVAIVPAESATAITAIAQSVGIPCQDIGFVTTHTDGPRVEYRLL
jgi:phosphoribosylformylglycinamidine cyclo-ligase